MNLPEFQVESLYKGKRLTWNISMTFVQNLKIEIKAALRIGNNSNRTSNQDHLSLCSKIKEAVENFYYRLRKYRLKHLEF